MLGPGLLCLSTVGALWFVPAVLLMVAGVMTVESWRDTGRAIADDWWRVLLSVLGGFEILMAAGASAVLMAVGVLSGLVLLVAPWLRSIPRPATIGWIVAGTVPFGVLAWTAVIPALVALVAAVLAIPILRRGSLPAPSHSPEPAVR